jgi:hypothetical protein
MPPPAPSPTIPLPYRLFHLYIEPILFVPSGILLSLFYPEKFLVSTSPAPLVTLAPPAITPLIRLLLTNTAGLYLAFVINEALVLRLTSDIRIWRAVIFSMLVCDVVHLYAVWAAAGTDFMLDFAAWRFEDWVNWWVLAAGAVVRLLFLCGVGFGRGKGGKGE